jgi:ABC-2 type transport system permease protein
MPTATIASRPVIEASASSSRVRVLPALTVRRLALTIRSPRAVLVPLLAPVLFALVVAPALASAVSAPAQRNSYMTFFCVATAGLLIPLNCMFSGLGVIIDRQHGALRELLAAPVRRSSIVFGNLASATLITTVQLVVLIAASIARGASFDTSARLAWFAVGAALLIIVVYGLAEILATRLTSAEEYTGAVPAIAIVPFFFAGSLYPITSMPTWLADVAKVLPLTHALALFRFGLTAGGGQALHNIWGLSSDTQMAALSVAVLALYSLVITVGAVRLFAKASTR